MNDSLVPEKIKDSLPPLNSTRHLRYDEICVHGKYSIEVKKDGIPVIWSWYLLEGEEQPNNDWLFNDWLFYGFTSKHEKDFEEFTLSDLMGIAKNWNVELRLKTGFKKKYLSEILEKLGVKWFPGDW